MNNRWKQLTAAVCAVFLLAGCSTAPAASSQPASQPESPQPQEDTPAAPIQVDAAAGVNNLGEEMLARLAKEEGNAFFSPLSFYLALSMLENGAGGATQEELAALLSTQPGLEGTAALNSANRELQEALNLSGKGSALLVGNSIWLRDSFAQKVEADFTSALESFYSAQALPLDMASGNAVDTINQCVSDQTNGLIQKAMESLDPNLQVLLLNTVYWKATWQTPFQAEATHEQVFRSSTGEKMVQMMHGSLELPYYEDGSCQAVALPCSDGRTSMVVVLPKEEAGEEVVLTADFLAKLQQEMVSRKVDLSLPRMDLSQSFEASGLLSAMGAGTMFTGEADLTGISREEGLSVGEVKHNAVLKVDEQGAEAAASTSIAVLTKALEIEPTVMTVDRPFQMAVVDGETGVALFEGQIADPQP